MKCPRCQANQKYSDGMTCNACGYRFALNPKQMYGMSDNAFRAVLIRLSGPNQHYFTYDQLYAAIYRLLRKKKLKERTGIIFVFSFLLIIISIVVAANLHLNLWGIFVSLLLVIIAFTVWLRKRPVNIPSAIAHERIQTYSSVHPVDRLVDGRQLLHMKAKDFDPELLAYAPERILIVQHNDMADMLILNRFHFDNKALVVSAEKYPEAAFTACQRFLMQHPDIPVLLIHDCSKDGIRMQGRLVKDRSWNLEGKRINNLGLHPGDVERLRTPMWVPPHPEEAFVRNRGPAEEYLRDGFRMPLDTAPPQSLMGSLGLAMVLGLPLLSEQLLAEQADSAGNGIGGGFG